MIGMIGHIKTFQNIQTTKCPDRAQKIQPKLQRNEPK
jgi:hypothetical protein